MLNCYWEPKSFTPVKSTFEEIGSERCFGVELEYSYVPSDNKFVNRMKTTTHFGGKDDCSVCQGGEFYSPILRGDEGLEDCKKLCKIAKKYHFENNEKAGCHIHLDMRKETKPTMQAIAMGYFHTADFWQGVVPQHRRSGEYVGRLQLRKHEICNPHYDNWSQFCANQPRYSWANFNAYNEHKTIEIRSHEATKTEKDLTMWIKAHSRFCDAMTKLNVKTIDKVFSRKRGISGIMREMRSIFSDRVLSAHFTRRFNQFNPATT